MATEPPAVAAGGGSTIPLREFLAGPGPRRLAAWVLGVSAFTALFAGSFLGALHRPRPHHVPIAVVAPTAAVATLQDRVNAVVPGGFALKPYDSAQRATTSLRDAGVDAVWIPPALPGAAPDDSAGRVAGLFTASALGAGQTQVIAQTFSGIGKAAGATVTVTDLVPLRAQDPFGISSFFFSVGVFFPSFLGSMVLALLLRRTPALATMAAILVLAVCVGLIDVAVADGGLGALVGHSGTLIGIGALTSLAFSAPTVAAVRLLRRLGAVLALLVFVVLGLPASGGPFGTAFLPAFHRAFSPGLPLTNAAYAVRNASYFGGHALAGHLGALALWAGAGLLVLGVIAMSEAATRPVQPTPSESSPPRNALASR